MRYYTIAMSNLVFRGSELIYLSDEFLGIILIALFFFVYGIKKIGKLF